MTEASTLASIDSVLINDVVIGAMALLVEDEPCEVAGEAAANADDVTVAVYCDHQQQSAVVLRCTHALARNLASKMLELEPDEVAPVDIVDATGELVNVIAGNLRGLVLSPGVMSPPFVVEDTEYSQFSNGATNTFSVAGEAMHVSRI